MAKSKAGLVVKTSRASQKRYIAKSLADQANKAFKRSARSSLLAVSNVVFAAVLYSEEMQSLKSGILKAELGLTDGIANSAPNAIASIVADQVELVPKRVSVAGNTLRGGMELNIMPTTAYSQILGIPQGSYTYYSVRYKKAVTINWLEWLLTKGDSILVADFDFVSSSKGRSGMGTMQKHAGSWNVPSSYSGTYTDNFITRALESKGVQSEITNIIKNNVIRYWGI